MRGITDLAFGAKPDGTALRAKMACACLSAALLLGGGMSPELFGQAQAIAAGGGGVVPQSIRFSGKAVNRAGDRVEVEFRIYALPEGGEPLWAEKQQVSIEQDGKYAVLLGLTTQGGLPVEVFGAGQARWVGVSIERGPEGARVPLISVPYAMKAADAQTLAGLPAAEFVTQGQLHEATTNLAAPTAAVTPETISGGGGTFGTLAYWTSPTTLGASAIIQLGTPVQPRIGVNLAPYATPGATLDVGGTVNARNGVTAVIQSVGGNAVLGTATAQLGFANGVKGQTSSPNGNGVYALNLSGASGNGVYGISNGTSGNGVLGINQATSGFSPGVTGITNSPNGAGVNGFSNTASGGIGVNGNAGTGGTALVGGNQSCGQSGCIFAAGTALSLSTGTGGTLIWAGTGLAGSAKSTPATREFAVDAGGNGYFNGNLQTSNGVNGNSASTANYASAVFGNEGSTTGVVYGVSGTTSSTTQFAAGINGFEGALTGQVFGIQGSTNTTTDGAAGVSGFEGGATGSVYGVAGSTNSTTTNAAGVWGYQGAATGQVYGISGSTNSAGPGAAAVNGWEGATTGRVWGVSGSTNSTGSGSAGVSGFDGATSGSVYGVTGSTNSDGPYAAGVNAYEGATSGVNWGLQATSASSQGIGVQGSSPNIGVSGWSQTCNSSGCAPAAGTAGQFFAGTGGLVLQGLAGPVGQLNPTYTQMFYVDASGNGYFAGNLQVKGTMSKGGGSFKIDDPLDPEHKYLSHSFVESPDMMNVYNGNVVTDKRGYATVVLPEYFDALNRDFRYQLTVMGQFAQAIVATKIALNRFVIRTNKPNVEVSWQVTGIRQDAWANANRIPVEEDKPASEQGRYLHPELFDGKDHSSEGPRGQGNEQR